MIQVSGNSENKKKTKASTACFEFKSTQKIFTLPEFNKQADGFTFIHTCDKTL